MNRNKCMKAVILAILIMVAGCARTETEPEETIYEEQEDPIWQRMLDSQDQRAETFSQDLCVIYGDEAEPDSSVEAAAAAVFSLDSREVILQRGAMERLYPASMTKVMTALVAIRHGNLADPVTVGEECIITEPGATLCHIRPGETLTLEQLLYGLMLPSGNDAGASIAVHISGSIEAFCDLMNEEARRLGATDTHFVNPHGLHDENHYTTAYDLYLIFREALKEPAFRSLIAASSYTARYQDQEGNPKEQTWKNSNKYISGELAMPEGLTALGGKTGTTSAAGCCLIMGSADEEHHEYVSVIMKAENRTRLYEEMTNIIQVTVRGAGKTGQK